ncbi:MAG: polyprenyl synthetase family protein [Bacteroidales bacterium]|nr:polyprenyl synthetase family protein [Bacteroidales bacterium]
MDIKAIQDFLGEAWLLTKERISSTLESDIALLNSTNESILSHSGKQMRPILTLLMARACSPAGVNDATVSYAAAADLLHNATLLHDDVADGSEQRRGKPTIMSLMGPSVSVLVGDYWLVKAMELILNVENAGSSGVMKIFAKTLSDLAEGEMLQLQKAQSGDTSEEDYLKIIYNKTASLFEAACVSAAISVDASEEYVRAAREYAVALGLAFQIQDDILDYSGTEAVGKPLGADILEQKITMPLLGALAGVSGERTEEVRDMIRKIADNPDYRDDIVSFVRENGGLEYAVARLKGYVESAIRALDVLPDSEARKYLVELAYYTAQRAL